MPSTLLRALIVDDEEPARENLRLMLEDLCPEVQVVGTADGQASARRMIGELDPEVIFLDIRMPSGTEARSACGSGGVEGADRIRYRVQGLCGTGLPHACGGLSLETHRPG
ncbi:MAG: response regulator [Flavobacteriales bacterium]|nr:response regulator [Flavobacteriales bacterium]